MSKIDKIIDELLFHFKSSGNLDVEIQDKDGNCEEVNHIVLEDGVIKLRSWPY